MAKQTVIVVTSAVDDLRKYDSDGVTDVKTLLTRLQDMLAALAAGGINGKLYVGQSKTLVQATGTVTFATAINGNTVTINGVVFTAAAAENQATNTFKVGVSNTADAASLAKIINGSTSAKIQGQVVASSAAAVVTIGAQVYGTAGNLFTLASSGATVTVSGANLTGGVGDVSTEYSLGLALP